MNKDFCLRNATSDEETSPRFDRLILARRGLIAYLYGENRALGDRLKGLEWEKEINCHPLSAGGLWGNPQATS